MIQEGYSRVEQLLIRWILVLVPTVLIGQVTLSFLNFSYTSLQTDVFSQTLYFGLGVGIAYSLYYFGARWVITVILLVLLYGLAERIISRLPGEFDVFNATARFQLYSTLFILGWIFGFLLARLRWAYIIIFGVLATVTLVSISNTVRRHLASPHMEWMVVMFLFTIVLTAWAIVDKPFPRSGRLAFLFLFLVLLIILTLGADYGSRLVFDYNADGTAISQPLRYSK